MCARLVLMLLLRAEKPLREAGPEAQTFCIKKHNEEQKKIFKHYTHACVCNLLCRRLVFGKKSLPENGPEA